MIVQIIMPNLNMGQYIGKAIESVLAQTRTDWELYVMDGGSTDDSIQVVKSYDDKRITLIDNIGSFPYRLNLAAEMSKSKYITYLAADDKFYPTFLAENIRILESNPEVDFVYNSYMDVKDNVRTPHPHYQYRKDLLLDCFYMGVFWMFKRTIWEEVMGIPEYTFTENIPFDYDLCLRVEEAGAKFYYLDKNLGWYRHHSGSDTGRHDNQYLVDMGERAKARARKRRGLC